MIKQSQTGDLGQRGALLCTSNATPRCRKVGFSSQVLIVKCLFLCPGCHNTCDDLLPLKGKAKAPRSFSGYRIRPELPPREQRLCFSANSTQNTLGSYVCARQLCVWEILVISLMQRAGGVDVATAGDSYQQDGCGRPDNRHLIHFSIQFAEPWCMMMDRNKLMISK